MFFWVKKLANISCGNTRSPVHACFMPVVCINWFNMWGHVVASLCWGGRDGPESVDC